MAQVWMESKDVNPGIQNYLAHVKRIFESLFSCFVRLIQAPWFLTCTQLLKIYFNGEIKSDATKAPVLTLSRAAAIWDLRASKHDGKNIEIIMLFSFPRTLKTNIYTLTVTVCSRFWYQEFF